MNRDTALVVFSGGQDSTTCLFWAKREFKKVYALSFLYGQKHQKEVDLARAIARKAGIIIELECLTGKNEDTDCQPQSQGNNLDEVGAFSSYQCLKSVI